MLVVILKRIPDSYNHLDGKVLLERYCSSEVRLPLLFVRLGHHRAYARQSFTSAHREVFVSASDL